jgi:hypothetical protein
MKALEPILKKEVTRKEFLTMAGFGLASLFGFSTIIKLLTGKSANQHFKSYSSGFGSSDYGGKSLMKHPTKL